MLANVNGVNINYEISGDESKPWLTFANSLATDLHMWDGQVEALSADYHILRYDKRGHGKSDAPAGPYTFDDLIGDLVGLWDHLGIEKTHYVGLSIGGMSGQGLLLKHGDRLNGVVLTNTMGVCRPEFVQAWEDRIGFAEEKGMGALVEPTMERWFTEGYRASGAAELEPVRKMIAATSTAGYAGCGRAIQNLAYLDQLHTLDHPVLLISGEHDGGTPPAGMELMHAEIKGSEYVMLDAAHIANIEKADEYTAQVKAFLAKH